MRRTSLLLLTALLFIFGGALLASRVQTSGGDVAITDIRFPGTGGLTMSALLYVPRGVNAQKRAPGVLAVHGYINSRETQSPYAIELARRGYVVLALDQTGHGYSDPPAFANGFGGPDGLAFLRTLPMVDPDQILLEGHSMGGWAVLVAAGTQREAYRAIAISGSSPGTYGAPEGDAKFPRNLGLLYARFDEFSDLMWGAPIAREIVDTQKLKTLFGTSERVEPMRLYGSIADGSARKLAMPAQTHPANHITRGGLTPVIDWAQQTVPAPTALSPDDQVWQWKELGTSLGLVGLFLFLFAFAEQLFWTKYFGSLREAPGPAHGVHGSGFWVAALLTMALPVLTYFPVQEQIAELVKPSAFLPQNITTGLLGWAWVTGLISLVLFAVWHFASAYKRGASAATYGLTWTARGETLRKVGRSLAFALVVVGAGYALLLVTDLLFKTDFRLWVVAAKPLGGLHARIALSYVVPFTLYFLVNGLVLHGQLRSIDSSSSLRVQLLKCAALNGLGFVALMLVQYVPLFAGGTMAFPAQHLLTIVAIQLVVVLPLVGMLSAYFFERTGHLYVGAFVNGLLVTWLLVGGQATHHPF